MNNFPAMTEEQRQLAGLCKIEINRWQAASESNPNMRYMADLMEIALAALTAEPRGYIDAGTPSDEINILTKNKILKTDIALYTAPPAPVLRVPDGWKLVPIVPTKDMVIRGFESEPDRFRSTPEEWAEYEAMSGCQQAAHKATLCWDAMLAAAPEVE